MNECKVTEWSFQFWKTWAMITSGSFIPPPLNSTLSIFSHHAGSRQKVCRVTRCEHWLRVSLSTVSALVCLWVWGDVQRVRRWNQPRCIQIYFTNRRPEAKFTSSFSAEVVERWRSSFKAREISLYSSVQQCLNETWKALRGEMQLKM